MSFVPKALATGDQMQLRPVSGEAGFFAGRRADFILTETHRHAKDSGVLELATLARRGVAPKFGAYRDSQVISAKGLSAETVMAADQVLVGRNETRHYVNRRLRELRGQQDPWPVVGDKLVCLQNSTKKGLLNGEIFFVTRVLPTRDERTIRLEIRPETGSDRTITVSVRREYFVGEESTLSPAESRRSDKFAYGYALTVHKAQGSQWDTVVLFDESASFPEEQARWRYTGITRAAQRITVVV
jgi:exodeoxyribonuclease-5